MEYSEKEEIQQMIETLQLIHQTSIEEYASFFTRADIVIPEIINKVKEVTSEEDKENASGKNEERIKKAIDELGKALRIF